MKFAIKEAKKASRKNFIPIGCIIIKNNKIIAKAHNQEFWHAEILCIQKAQKKIGKYLLECKIFITVQPCPMCLHAIKLSRIKHVLFGCDNSNEPLPNIEITKNIQNEECKKIIKNFFRTTN